MIRRWIILQSEYFLKDLPLDFIPVVRKQTQHVIERKRPEPQHRHERYLVIQQYKQASLKNKMRMCHFLGRSSLGELSS